ncbi:MAG: hypothetical protein E6K76_10610 [Candidatus Eisenbacteria bacterium]|uniref:Uncharacterized protein n=1 Tax=Eiseniibacteriota bacterium TaxID=2212470 RepID=A0A538T171_UNCEI|nr:MAG: hypothetical protein E6K76_10610 [Candidatus Eisenbacteria bacterium]
MRQSESRYRLPSAVALVFCPLLLLAATTAAWANPSPIPAGSKLVFNFNVIGYPATKSYGGDCGNGHRIFVNRDAKGAQVRVTNSTTDWSIVDCNATAGHQAVLATNQVGIYDIYVRILGKIGGNLHVCADTLSDFLNGETLCQVGTIDLTRGKGQSKFTLAPSAMFDASLVDLMWTVDANPDFRIAQFRVYSRP